MAAVLVYSTATPVARASRPVRDVRPDDERPMPMVHAHNVRATAPWAYAHTTPVSSPVTRRYDPARLAAYLRRAVAASQAVA